MIYVLGLKMWVHANSPELLRSRELIEPGHATKQTLWKPLCYYLSTIQLFLRIKMTTLQMMTSSTTSHYYAFKTIFPWESRAGAISNVYRVNDNRFIYRISQRFLLHRIVIADKHLKAQMIRHPSRRLTGQDWQVYPSILNEKFARCNVPIARWPNSRPSIALLL